jgi:hypothetical protein
MRYASLARSFMMATLATASLAAQGQQGQPINPSQIRPSATNGQVITTVSGQTIWANAPSSACTDCIVTDPTGNQIILQQPGTIFAIGAAPGGGFPFFSVDSTGSGLININAGAGTNTQVAIGGNVITLGVNHSTNQLVIDQDSKEDDWINSQIGGLIGITGEAGVSISSLAGDVSISGGGVNGVALGTTTMQAGATLNPGAGAIVATAVGGITVTGTPSAGQILAATSSTAAHWVTPAVVIANTTTTVGTTLVGANSCSASATTVTMTGLATTSTVSFTHNADVSAVTGWGSTGGLTIDAWPTANTLNYKVCNATAASITPSASVTFNVSAR